MMWISEYEHGLIPLDDRNKIREKPSIDIFDDQFLHIIELWHGTLGNTSLLENEDSPISSHWPYALTGLNQLIMKCHDRIYRYRMHCPKVYRRESDHSTPFFHDTGRGVIDDMARGVIETDVALSRVVIVELLSANFGDWLDSNLGGRVALANFSKRRASFNVDYITMDLDWAIAGSDDVVTHAWAKLPIHMLFLDADPELLCIRFLQQKQRKELLKSSGAWGSNRYTLTPVDFRSERIEARESGQLEQLSLFTPNTCRQIGLTKDQTLPLQSKDDEVQSRPDAIPDDSQWESDSSIDVGSKTDEYASWEYIEATEIGPDR
ncbi:hypothetical protein E0Z10_g10279 [Xylaria hypoxylon]|uniref:Uncharacterized protein n=1 Tax=Xylaria hypoxylon TaxID=37992 RepID=A0A4Z0YIB3_9PEZI|nr:hypothetical protein E0Z10_g10279 [Xylaria hypoxylon]